MNEVVVAVGVSKRYLGRTLYRDVSFAIPSGQVTRVAGPNGSGKSVLLRLMCGFARPNDGSVTIDPRYLSARRSFPERFGVVIDRPGYLAGETGLRNLLELANIRREIDQARVREVMESLGLDPDLRQKVRHYSLGMKQKLAVAQAIMEYPEVLILDEPFNALDSESVSTLHDLLTAFVKEGKTLVFTSHDPAHLADITSQTLEVQNGTVTTAAEPSPV